MPIQYDIVIPAFNAHNSLPKLLKQIDRLPQSPHTVFIIDDGSEKTYSLPQCHHFSVKVIRFNKNAGKGAAIQKGLNLFLNKNGTQYVLLMDADGQHPVDSIPHFLTKVEREATDLVIGNRTKKIGKMPLLRIFSNTVSSLIVSWVTGTRISDSQCGFRLLHRRLAETIRLQEKGFQVETELIIKAVKRGFNVQFITIPTIYNGEKSNIKHISDTIRFIQIIVRELLSR